MPVEVNDKGTGNRIELDPWFENYGRLRINFSGNNNLVRIPFAPGSCNGAVIDLGHNCTVEAGKMCRLANIFVAGKNNAHLKIGEFSTFMVQVRFIMNEPSSIEIGRDCMIASDVQFMTSDSHTIYDVAERRRLNAAANIKIGDHVWIAVQCFVMKGVEIGAGSILGLRSVALKDIPGQSLAVGCPARVVKRGVAWDRLLWNAAEGGH